MVGIFDTHCHLNADEYQQKIDFIIHEARKARVLQMCTVGYDLVSSKQAVDISVNYEGVWSAIGIHPNEIQHHQLNALQEIEKLATLHQVVAIGEIGLDRSRHPEQINEQKKWFIKQILIAQKHHLPVIIHCRDAYEECYQILQQYKTCQGIMHCFLGNVQQVKKFINLGFYISFSGVVTFKNATNLIDTIKAVPLNRLLVETDAPYLSPEPNRGRINYPHYIHLTLTFIAKVKKIDLEALIQITTENARLVYRVPD